MHTVHLIACRISPSESVEDAVDRAVGGPSWWDWYEVGGRWSNYLAEALGITGLEHPDVLPVAGREADAVRALDGVAAQQDSSFREHRDYLTGAAVAVSDLSGHVFGLPVAADEAAAARLTAAHQEHARAWAGVLSASGLSEIGGGPTGLAGMAMWHASRMIDLAQGTWNPDSGFYDAESGTASPDYLLGDLRGRGEDRAGLSLVVVDFHF